MCEYVQILVKKSHKRQFVRLRHRRNNNMKIVLQEIGCTKVKWIILVQNRVQWCSYNDHVPSIWISTGNFLIS
jgi:hypothetical protein